MKNYIKNIVWQRDPVNFPAIAQKLLCNNSSLTAALQALDPTQLLTIRLLQNHFIANNNIWLREVVISLGTKDILRAISLFPRMTLQRYQDEILSNQPLGLWLFKQSGLQRRCVKYAMLAKDAIIPARKSVLQWEQGKVLIYEILITGAF